MRLGNRVAEFEGRGQLVEAAQTVLSDPNLHLAVVKGITEVIGQEWEDTNHRANGALILDHVPEVKGVETTVKNWWEDASEVEGFSLIPGIGYAFHRESLVKTHVDPHTWVGLTMSFRTDTREDIKRDLYTTGRSEEPTIRDGHKNLGAVNALYAIERSIGNNYNILWRSRLARAAQSIGSCIIMPNHPFAALHASHSSDMQGSVLQTASRALVVGFRAQPTRVESAIPTGSFPKATIKV